MVRKTMFAISARDWPDLRKMLEEFRKVGRTLRHPDRPVERRGGRNRGLRRGLTNAAHAKGDSGVIKWIKGGLDSGETFTAVNRFASLGADKNVVAAWVDGEWTLIAGEC